MQYAECPPARLIDSERGKCPTVHVQARYRAEQMHKPLLFACILIVFRCTFMPLALLHMFNLPCGGQCI